MKILTDKDRANIGEEWAQFFNLKKSKEHPDRYEMTGGTKTALGVYRTVRGLVKISGEGYTCESTMSTGF